MTAASALSCLARTHRKPTKLHGSSFKKWQACSVGTPKFQDNHRNEAVRLRPFRTGTKLYSDFVVTAEKKRGGNSTKGRGSAILRNFQKRRHSHSCRLMNLRGQPAKNLHTQASSLILSAPPFLKLRTATSPCRRPSDQPSQATETFDVARKLSMGVSGQVLRTPKNSDRHKYRRHASGCLSPG